MRKRTVEDLPGHSDGGGIFNTIDAIRAGDAAGALAGMAGIVLSAARIANTCRVGQAVTEALRVLSRVPHYQRGP